MCFDFVRMYVHDHDFIKTYKNFVRHNHRKFHEIIFYESFANF